MESTCDDLYYQALIPLKDLSVVSISQERINPCIEYLGMRHLLSVELITGRNGSTQLSRYLRITFLSRYERLSVRLTQDPKLIGEVTDLFK